MQNLTSVLLACPRVLHLQIKFPHEKLTCVSNTNAAMYHNIVCSRHFKIISSCLGVDTRDKNKN